MRIAKRLAAGVAGAVLALALTFAGTGSFYHGGPSGHTHSVATWYHNGPSAPASTDTYYHG